MATWLELGRRLLPNESPESIDTILWNETAFPMTGNVLTIARQLKRYGRRKRGGWSTCMRCGGAFRYPGGRISADMCAPCKIWWKNRDSE